MVDRAGSAIGTPATLPSAAATAHDERTPHHRAQSLSNPLTILAARAEALAILIDLGEMEIDEALERLLTPPDGFDLRVEWLARQKRVGEAPRNRQTPQSTIEAIMHCVRERGVAALNEPENIERLSRCGAAAKAQIHRRIYKLKQFGRNQ
jgi:hypothetical protein